MIENVELPAAFRWKSSAVGAIHWPAKRFERVGLSKRLDQQAQRALGRRAAAHCAGACVSSIGPSSYSADEPTGNLDSRTGTEIMNLIREFNESLGMTVVMVTHERMLAERLRAAPDFSCGRKIGGRSGERRRSDFSCAGRPSVKAYDLAELGRAQPARNRSCGIR